MKFYETLYIIHPALETGRLKDIIMNVEDSLKKMGGEPLTVELWGRRKLSYYIDKQKYGTYVLVQYNGEGKCTGDFAIELEHNPNILAYVTTLINQKDVLEQEEDLDTQIAGKTRETEKADPPKRETPSPEEKEENKTADSNNSEQAVSTEKDEKIEQTDLGIETAKETPKDEQSNLSSIKDVDEQTDTSESETKEKINELTDDLTIENEESSQSEEESNQENADGTAAVSKKE